MSNKELTKIAFKIFAIYIMVQALLTAPQFFQAYILLSNGTEYNSANWFITISAVSITVLIILSVFIWKLSNNISAQAISKDTNESLNISEPFVLSVLGVYLIVFSLTRLSITSVSTFYILNSPNDTSFNINQNIVYLIIYFIVTLLGVSLVIKTNGWVNLLNKLRVAGT